MRILRNPIWFLFGSVGAGRPYPRVTEAAQHLARSGGSNAPHRSCYFDDRGGIHAQDLARHYHIRRYVPVHYWSPCRRYMVRPLRHWLRQNVGADNIARARELLTLPMISR